MPYGTKDPSSYTTNRTEIIIRPEVPGTCCTCHKTNKPLCPAFLDSLMGLVAVFVCQSCYAFQRVHPDIRYEQLLDRGNGIKTSYPSGQRRVKSADRKMIQKALNPDLARDIDELRVEILDLRKMIKDLQRRLDSLNHAPSASVPEKIVPEQTVSDSSKTVSDSSKTVSEPKKPIKIRVTEHKDDDIEFGMTPEQKARMEEAVKVAKSREGTVIEAPSGW